MTPDYSANADQGYMGDWRRGAPMGRGSIKPDARMPNELETEAAQADAFALDAERDKENRRTPDAFKRQYWQTAADRFRMEAAELRAMIPAARERVAASPKITLRRVRLDSGGYDSQGTYFGHGDPIYWAAGEDGAYDATMRAADRDEAKAIVRETFPGARFYN